MSVTVLWASYSQRQIGVVGNKGIAGMAGMIGSEGVVGDFGGNSRWIGNVGAILVYGMVASLGDDDNHFCEVGAVGSEERL